MKQFSYVLTKPMPARIRSMSSLLREASRFTSRVRLSNGERDAALEQLRAVSELEMDCGNRITVTVEGRDEEAAVAALQNYFVTNL